MPPVASGAQQDLNILFSYIFVIPVRVPCFCPTCTDCFTVLLCWFSGSRTELVSRQIPWFLTHSSVSNGSLGSKFWLPGLYVVSEQNFFAAFFVSWPCRAFISNRGSISLNFLLPAFVSIFCDSRAEVFYGYLLFSWPCRASSCVIPLLQRFTVSRPPCFSGFVERFTNCFIWAPERSTFSSIS